MGGPRRTATEKRCNTCLTWKPLDDFYKSRNRTTGRVTYTAACRPCHNQITITSKKAKRSEDVELVRARERRVHKRWMLKRFGLTEADFDRMLVEQDNRCAICRSESPKRHRWHIDHCHKTDRVRGLLCSECNLGLGKFKDSADVVQRAADYLRKSENDTH